MTKLTNIAPASGSRSGIRTRIVRALTLALLAVWPGSALAAQWHSEDEIAQLLIGRMDSFGSAQGYSKDVSKDICGAVLVNDLERVRAKFGWVKFKQFNADGLLARNGDMVWETGRPESVFYSRSLLVTVNKYTQACDAWAYVHPFFFRFGGLPWLKSASRS